ncbi:DUF397 domain-containing protein [Yinghuangia soli]|uniref:DUF397 domain-containing protein n=1 Tax=Yinghuangia soli TaxID=2908204 RepID=A0AA41TX77_9ACTN|nr:DUF397 domain-containing protein [Yinghuangia soli]MCF2526558.1 DUF397 domain-containing protein [Yinghuangia soli]
MAEPSKTEGTWRTSSYSDDDDQCVEVLLAAPVRVRDSRRADHGELRFATAAWRELGAAMARSALH